MINTLNESLLHKKLKSYYSIQNEGSRTEVKHGQYIADILTKDNTIIEIQTANLSRLYDKIQYCIDQEIQIKAVYPLVTTKYIETFSEEGKLISKRKSPQHKNIYSIFKELTSLYKFLQNKFFILEIIEVTMTEIRENTKIPVQSKNKRRRFMKSWIKTGKRLEEIGKSYIFNSKKEYLKLMPEGLKEEFTVKDVLTALKKAGIKAKEQSIRCMIWVYNKSGLLEQCGTIKRCYVYRICKKTLD
ncbi:MAG: hypothetical protein K6G00_12410 [Treponema sp.]|nr:hypothetical protein [Treponema sp.]